MNIYFCCSLWSSACRIPWFTSLSVDIPDLQEADAGPPQETAGGGECHGMCSVEGEVAARGMHAGHHELLSEKGQLKILANACTIKF